MQGSNNPVGCLLVLIWTMVVDEQRNYVAELKREIASGRRDQDGRLVSTATSTNQEAANSPDAKHA